MRGLVPALAGALVTAPAALAAPPTDTPAPEPQSVRLVGPQEAEACFDAYVQTPDPSRFALLGYASAATPVVPTTAQVDAGDRRCVRLTFPPGLDLAGFTLATVAANAVQDLAGRVSVPGARPLEGSYASPRAGQTTGPQLLDTSADGTLNTLTFTYSRPLDPTAAVDPAQFGFYTASGALVTGDPATPAVVSGRQVTIGFVGGTSVLDAVRTFALTAAVRSHTQQLPSAHDVVGDTTGLPDLIEAQAVPALPGVYELTYDTDVAATTSTVANCAAILEDGTRAPGVSFARPNLDQRRVTVAFGMLAASNDSKIVRIVDEGGCAVNQSISMASSRGAIGVRALNMAPGFTDGPDLLDVLLDATNGFATFRFDQDLDPATATATGFSLVHADGVLTSDGLKVSTATPTRDVVMQFTHDAVEGSVGGAVAPGAIADFLGTPSPLGTAGLPAPQVVVEPAAAPAVTTAAPPPPPAAAPQGSPAPGGPWASARVGRRADGTRYVALRVYGTKRYARVVIGLWNRRGRYYKKLVRTVPGRKRVVIDHKVPRRTRGAVVAVRKVF
jgi:hypothetical protein